MLAQVAAKNNTMWYNPVYFNSYFFQLNSLVFFLVLFLA